MADSYLGEIKIWPISRVPQGWHLCDGTVLTINDYQALYSLLGTTYGGNGTTNFALPDLRGRTPIHKGTGTGLSARALGQFGGANTVTVSTEQMPIHDHSVFASNTPATTNIPTQTSSLGSGTGGVTIYSNEASSGTDFVMDAGALTPAGGGQPHANLMPSLALNFIICLNAGVYPTAD